MSLHHLHRTNFPGDQQLRGIHGPQLKPVPFDPYHQLAARNMDLFRAVGQNTLVPLHAQLFGADQL